MKYTSILTKEDIEKYSLQLDPTCQYVWVENNKKTIEIMEELGYIAIFQEL